jgi:hypothetical protein
LVGGELEADVVGVHKVKSLREVDVGTSFAFAGAVHVRTAEDGEEVGGLGKGIIG